MANKINFVTGETYTIGELFSGNRQIIIPDLQRDYCWGNPDHNLVEGFIGNLLEQFHKLAQSGEKLNFGLIYGYETPADHIQLCDGQQRITTLFLLLGMLNRKCQKFRLYLIPDAKYKQGDKEPYLNYAIRETSLYFLGDLVEHFFIGSSMKKVNDIRQADWYFADYDLDPSIQSMLFALEVMEKQLLSEQVNFVEFGNFLCNNLTFQYYDMQTRKNGEETFVIINTTGEPLTSTQNLKPLVINAKINNQGTELAQHWEEIETWFWKNRNLNNGNDTADVGMDEFLRWVTMIEQAGNKEETTKILETGNYSFPYEKISFEKIRSYWKTIVWMKGNGWLTKFCSDGKDCLSPKDGRISQIDCFILLPIIKFSQHYLTELTDGIPEIKLNLKRAYEFFVNLARLESVSKNVNDLVAEALHIVEIIVQGGGDLIALLEHTSEISERLLTNEETKKLTILSTHPQRNNLEKYFWDVQKYEIWKGEIMPLIAWATTSAGFDMQKFIQYTKKFDEVFTDAWDGIDSVRRALLTLDLSDYPRIFYGYTKISFGWGWPEWKILINGNQDKMKIFFDRLLTGETLDQMIESYKGNSIWKAFIKKPELLAYCGKKKVQRSGNNLLLLTRERTSAEYQEVRDFFVSEQTQDSL